MQCAQRWEELLLATNSAVAGDFSGLTATGRPISGYRQKRPMKMAHSVHDQSKVSSGLVQDLKRPHSVAMSARIGSAGWSRDDDAVSQSVSTEVWGHINQKEPVKPGLSNHVENQMRTTSQRREELASRATFAANFCQNLLTKNKDHLNSHDKEQPREDDKNKPSGTRTESTAK